jgi:DNA/RNA-binding domain of Phe-tRNA-synthetase-like protein
MAFALTGNDGRKRISRRPPGFSTVGAAGTKTMTLQARPRSLPIAVEDALRGVLAIGVLEADHASADPLPAAFHEERDRIVRRWVTQYGGRQPADVPGVAETRALFHALGIDPTKHRPSSEALLRRVLQGKGLPVVSPIVDVCNLSSLEHQLPLGLYDRDLVHGEVVVRLGRDDEGYEGIRGKRVNLFGRLLLADEDGAFGAPTSDSLRTSITPATRNVAVAVFCPAHRAAQGLSAALEHVAGMLSRHCGATVTTVRVAQ